MKLSIYVSVAAILALGVSACETTPNKDEAVAQVSVRYDPYDYNVAELRRDADAECHAKGARYAIEAGNTPNYESPRWAYMTFNCYN